MRTALKYLLESENAGDVIAFLRSRGPRAHIIAPAWVRAQVIGENLISRGRHAASWSEAGAGSPVVGENVVNYLVVAEDAEQERRIISSLDLRNRSKAYGLFCHVVPALLCSVNGMAPGRPTGDLKKYAILCIPRSGSRYLSAVLSNRGVGAPREHIREPLAHIIADGKLGFGTAVDLLEQFGQKNGIFGTKLISTFLIRASQRRIEDVKANVAWMIDRGYRLMRLNRPLNDAVISSYIAYQMRKWHFFGAMDQDTRVRLDSLEFEDGAAWDEFIRFRAEKVVVDALGGWFDIPGILYSEIESNIDGVVSELCGVVGVEADALKPGSVPVPVPTRSESPTYGIFEERLTALLDRRAGDIDSSTVRKLRAICKFSEKAAEELIAESA